MLLLGMCEDLGRSSLWSRKNKDLVLGASQEKQQCVPGSSLTNSLLSMSPGFDPK